MAHSQKKRLQSRLTILVTGGAGFIGRNLVRRLLSDGHTVRVLDAFTMGSYDHFIHDFRGIDLVRTDIRNFPRVRHAMRGVDLVYHLASPSSFLMYEQSPIRSAMITVQGFLHVLESMKAMGVGRLVYTSTSAVYEGNALPYTESMRLSPPDLKAQTKKFNEELAHEYSHRYGLATIGLRPFSVYGPGEETKRGYANVISLFAWTMLKGNRPVVWDDGSQTRDFVYIDDVVEALIRAKDTSVSCDVCNVGTGKETSFNRVIKLINVYLRTHLHPIYTPIPLGIYARRLLADTTRQERVLGWRPRVSVEEGVARTIRAAKNALSSHRRLASYQTYYTTIASMR